MEGERAQTQRLDRERDPTYDYTEVGNRKSVTLPSAVGIKTSYAYDILNRLTGLTNRANDNSILSQFNYQVDATGRRTNATEIVKTEDASPTYQTNTLSWAYDGLYRLTNEVCVSSVSGASYTNRFQYDKAGNRWSQIRIVNSGTTTITNQYNPHSLISGTSDIRRLLTDEENTTREL